MVTDSERLRLPIRVTGSMSDPVIRYAMATAREHRQEKFAREREQIKAVFAAEKQRYGNRGDERKPAPMPPAKERNDFVITFEDDAVSPAPTATPAALPDSAKQARKKKPAPAKRDTAPAAPVPVVIEWDD